MQIGYLLKEGLSGFKRTKLAMIAAITTIAISLLILSSFTILSLNANRIVESLRERVEMEAFLVDYLSPVEQSMIRDSIAAIEGIREVRYISKAEAATIFKEEFGEDINRVLDHNPLPASIKIYLKDGYKTVKGAEAIVLTVKAMKGIEDVIYRKSLLEMLETRAQTLLLFILGTGVFIMISSIFLVANTIRLAIYAKRKIIQTMKLIGATRSFIRWPFVLEGLLQGFIGGIIAAVIVFLVFEYLGRWLSVELYDLVQVHSPYYAIILLVGCLLGLFGSLISVRRFIGESIHQD
ncbi:MAG: permease-like cell division protein FtsX [bacterium]